MILEDFHLPNAELNLTAAAQMAAICCMVYENEPEAIRAFIGPESTLALQQPAEGTWVPGFAVINSGPHRWFVVVEGTISFLQALAQACPLNTLRRPDNSDPDKEHFYGLFYYQVFEQLLERVRGIIPFDDPQLQLYLSGHSMGGAVAQVGAFEFAQRVAPERVSLLTIAQPAAACANFDGVFPGVYFRLASYSDPVPEYPFAPATYVIVRLVQLFKLIIERIDWAQYGQLVTLHASGTLDGSGKVPYPLPNGMVIDGVLEHFLGNYLARILQAAEVQEPD